MEIRVNNVNEALSEGLHWLRLNGIPEKSRNGTVIVSPEPVLTEYNLPMERVLFSPRRDANPYFHLMEALWMIAGRNDLVWPMYFNSKFASYSDDGATVHGAYGKRWRRNDQITVLANELRNNPESRRCVLANWDLDMDLPLLTKGKDVPCNTHVYFEVKDGLINQTVCCRSNDIIWGAYGANAVHFSVLLEYMAALSGYGVGKYRQFSNNYHMYTNVPNASRQEVEADMLRLALDAAETNHYASGESGITASPIINTPVDDWEIELDGFLKFASGGHIDNIQFHDPFWKACAIPMFKSWAARKNKVSSGILELSPMSLLYPDWFRACREWIERREIRKAGVASETNAGRI
jgi:hypothetical protein